MNLAHLVDVIFNGVVFAFIGVTIWLYFRREETETE